MNYMIAILPKMAGFLLLVLIGFTASRIGVIKKEAMPSISGFLLKIVLPALTISLIWENQTTFYTMARYGRMVIAQILMYFIMAAGGILGSRICHLSGTTSNVHRGCSVGGNYGFLVIPLIMTLFGDQGGNVYIPICSVIDTTLVCSPDLDALLVVDTTKGNRVINTRGFAISPTVKEGYVLRTSEDLLDLMQITTGRLPYVFPLATQDITPYGNDVHHLNSILQPCTATDAPVVGVAITAETMVPGCATGATHAADVEEAARFMLEVAKAYGRKQCSFYDADEYARLQKLYGSMKHLQTLGNE